MGRHLERRKNRTGLVWSQRTVLNFNIWGNTGLSWKRGPVPVVRESGQWTQTTEEEAAEKYLF